MKLKPVHYFIIFFIIAISGIFAARFWSESRPGQYDTFAQCIADSGATFYGAFWCPHCEEQRDMFGNSARLLPYVECSTPDGQNQTQECRDADISSYPTWDMPGGDRVTGVQSFGQLSDATGCSLEQQ